MTKYQVHIGYVSEQGEIILPGIYTDTQISLPEARNKSIVTLVNTVPTKPVATNWVEEVKTKIMEPTLNILTPSEVKNKEVKPTIIENTFDKADLFKINSESVDAIEKLKYIGKKTAETVVDQRTEKLFIDYIDLNARVPLKMKRKWEDIVPIDFENGKDKVTNHLVSYT